MSILSWPRANFAGIFRANPCTCNNNDVLPAVVNRDTNTLGPTVATLTDEEIGGLLRRNAVMSNYQAPQSRFDFVQGGWNVYGDHFTNFDQCTITSIVRGLGDAHTAQDDPTLADLTFRLLPSQGDGSYRGGDPLLVDVDPTGLVTSQIWLGGFEITSGTGDDAKTLLRVHHDTRAFQDWLNFMSTVSEKPYGGEQNFTGIGAMLQFAVPADAIPADADPGPLAGLVESARKAAGLVIRFRVHEVEPAIVDQDLAKLYESGQGMQNPAYGYVEGTIGVWEAGEPSSEPPGRKLVPPSPRPPMSWAKPDGGEPQSVPGAPKPWQGPPALIGNVVAHVRADPPVISLDLVGAFPKYGYRNPDGPPAGRDPYSPPPGFDVERVKADVGHLQLAYLPAEDADPVPIADIDYGLGDYSTYRLFGGIQDVEYDKSLHHDITTCPLVIVGKAGSKLNEHVVVSAEEPVRVVTDDRGVYAAPDTKGIPVAIRVYELGGPPTSDVTVYPTEYYNIIEVDDFDPVTAPEGYRPNQSTAIRPADDCRLAAPERVVFPAGSSDWRTIEVEPATVPGTGGSGTPPERKTGVAVLNYQLDRTPWGPSVPAWSTATYSTIRIYTNDDFSHFYESGPLQWEDVYRNVLRYYYVLFPFMSTIIPLNQQASILRHAALLKDRLNTPDQPGFYKTTNMPITRTMSPAKIKLLLDWVDQQGAGTGS